MSNAALTALLPEASRKFVLLDANLLLLWITSLYDLRLLKTFKRVQAFSQADAILLAWIVDRYQGVATTSHVVTEVCNLANALSSSTRQAWFGLLADFSLNTTENTPLLKILARQEEFVRFGITDSALSSLSEQYHVLTTDYRLSNYLRSSGRHVLNFRDLQQASNG
jgi:rRNA-processing protein FCF1